MFARTLEQRVEASVTIAASLLNHSALPVVSRNQQSLLY
jgi:hypothetical protein